MLEYLAEPSWSPYVAGAGIGIIACLTLLPSDRPLGCSTAYAKAGGLIDRIMDREATGRIAFYKKVVPAMDWQFLILPGIITGAFVSSAMSGNFHIFFIPGLWASMFGRSVVLRISVAFTGGLLLAIGSRWAGGCTTGHGISGTLQLAISGIVSTTCFFIGGILTAFFLFGIIGA